MPERKVILALSRDAALEMLEALEVWRTAPVFLARVAAEAKILAGQVAAWERRFPAGGVKHRRAGREAERELRRALELVPESVYDDPVPLKEKFAPPENAC